MPRPALTCYRRLSPPEQASLHRLCTTGTGRDIPADHATRLLHFGLAELTCGDLGATGAARVVDRQMAG